MSVNSASGVLWPGGIHRLGRLSAAVLAWKCHRLRCSAQFYNRDWLSPAVQVVAFATSLHWKSLGGDDHGRRSCGYQFLKSILCTTWLVCCRSLRSVMHPTNLNFCPSERRIVCIHILMGWERSHAYPVSMWKQLILVNVQKATLCTTT